MDKFEELLRQFEPRRPRPLPEVTSGRRRWQYGVAIAASIAGGVAIVLLMPHHPGPSPDVPDVAVTIGAFMPQGLTKTEHLDEILSNTSREILPDVERSGGVLQALSKE